MGPQLRGWEEEGIMQNWGQAMVKERSESAQGPRPWPQQEEPPQLLFPGAEGRRAWAAAVPQVGGTAAHSGWGARLWASPGHGCSAEAAGGGDSLHILATLI